MSKLSTRRVFDVTIGVIGLTLSAPLILLMAGISGLESGESGIFRQTRYGLHGKPFTIYKIRTLDRQMKPLLIAGSFRKFGLDEWPQLFNLINTDMSIIGPRPHTQLSLTEEWKKAISIPPGFASPATILIKKSGLNLSQDDKAVIDLPYVEKRLAGEPTFWTDLKILFDGARIIISGRADNSNAHKTDISINNKQKASPVREP